MSVFTPGATLTGVAFPPRHAGLGPFRSSSGAFYFFGRDTTNTGHVKPMKVTGQTTVAIAAGVDDQYVLRSGASYPPTGAITRSAGATEVDVRRNLSGATFTVSNGLLAFDTSAVPDEATIVQAVLRLHVGFRSDLDVRNLDVEYYDWDGSSTTDHANEAPATPAGSATLASLLVGLNRDVSLTNTAGINRSGITKLRLHISGGQPTSTNWLQANSLESTGTEPQLIITYSDPINGTWIAQTTKLMSTAAATAIEAVSCQQVGDLIHVATQLASGAVYYNQYNMATDAWVLATSENPVPAAAIAPSTGSTFVSLVVREEVSGSHRVVVICYAASRATVMGVDYDRLNAIRRTGASTYQPAFAIDNGDSRNWTNATAVLGDSDRVHIFMKDDTNADAYQRTYTQANTLQTFPASYDANVAVANMVHGTPQTYLVGGAKRIRVPYLNSTGRFSIAKIDASSDAPTVTTEADIGDNVVKVTTEQPVSVLGDVSFVSQLNPENIMRLLYADSTNSDLYHDAADVDSPWSTDIPVLEGVTINALSGNVLDRAGEKFSVVYDDGGTVRYGEMDLSPTTQTFAPESGVAFY